ncbi:hypothetical protein JCM33374_g4886 [Metschnikowia sp. JCM 33374]|nr:hypothetical protein JCM33374_g4886 [Metschnikowia sp. JCM 33374]
MDHLHVPNSSSYPPPKQPFQPKLQSIPSVSLLQNPFLSASAPAPRQQDTETGRIDENSHKFPSNLASRPPDLSPSLKNDSPFFSALPVLVSLPLTVIASDLSVSASIVASKYAFAVRVAVSLLHVCLLSCIGKLSTRFKLAEPSFVRVSVDLGAGLVLFYLASSVLSATRVSVLYFCLFVNYWNVGTPLSFIYDIHVAYQTSVAETGPVCAGYLALACSFWLVNKAATNTRPKSTYTPPFPAVCLLGAVLLLGLFASGAVALPFLAITLATSSLLLFSASHNHVSSKINILVIALFSYCLECFVLSTRRFSRMDAAVCILLPCLTKVDRLRHSMMRANSESDEAPQKPKILTEILSHSDTKAIFHFLMLNTAFMFVQLLYSFRSKSLGLLSDSLHMALDCASLALGLIAGILSKNPVNPNSKYPFGLKNFENLAGFANGTLLVGISGSIIFEAIGRLLNPVALQQTTELIVVSILGLLVNVVGIFAFNHGHSHSHGGHSHGHSHGHSCASEPTHSDSHVAHCDSHNGGHSQSHNQSHGHSHDDVHSQSHNQSHGHSHDDSHNQSHNQSHDHSSGHSHTGHSSDNHAPAKSENTEESTEMNDNMRGIFLHILADTLGSVGVVISTVLTKMFHWQGFDPVASIIIAVLIFMTAVPLMKSTASTLLLKLDTKKEATVRCALNELTTIRGIKSFTTPRFWASDGKLGGFIHIQVYRGENTALLKKQCEEIFKIHHIDALIQMENDYDPCWCRT